ncbi:hypothetical protein Ae263Ps1_1999 [Pseudonocardia sp. Ae263_Ps1]|nr:hypothetical protein Ae263Ps1_1999 [Pseudonocardia sp. Ae263_Ps1]
MVRLGGAVPSTTSVHGTSFRGRAGRPDRPDVKCRRSSQVTEGSPAEATGS